MFGSESRNNTCMKSLAIAGKTLHSAFICKDAESFYVLLNWKG